MSVYVMSDLHGCLEEFEAMLDMIEFSDEDKLYVIGDVVDRGPKSMDLLKRIMGMKNAVMLLGNHEQMMIKAIASGDFAHWNLNRGEETYKQFISQPVPMQAEMIKYILRAPSHIDIDVGERKFHLVHACPDPREEPDMHVMLWERPERDRLFFDDKTAIVGHTPTCMLNEDGSPLICHGKNVVYIDCGCFFTGVLGCLRLDDMEEFYVMPETCNIDEQFSEDSENE